MKPVCVPCKLFYQPKKNGTYFEEGMPVNEHPPTWSSYKLWVGDLWECAGCGAQIIVGVATEPVAEHYQPKYKSLVAKTNPLLRVDDC